MRDERHILFLLRCGAKERHYKPWLPNSQPWFSATMDDEAAAMVIQHSQRHQLPIRGSDFALSMAGALAFTILSAPLQKCPSWAASLHRPTPPLILMANPSEVPGEAHNNHTNQFVDANLLWQTRYFFIDMLQSHTIFSLENAGQKAT